MVKSILKFCIESGIIFDRDIWEIGAAGAQLPYKQTVHRFQILSPTIITCHAFAWHFYFGRLAQRRALPSHGRGHRFNPVTPHHRFLAEVICLGFFIVRQSMTKTRMVW